MAKHTHIQLVLVWWSWILSRRVHAVPQPDAISPVSNFDNSWTASSIQSTTCAVCCTVGGKQSAAVVLMKGGDERLENCAGSSADDWIEVGGLRVRLHRPDRATTLEASPRWTQLGPSTLCCMTGLMSDVDHLSRVLQNEVDSHRVLFEGSRIMPTVELLQELTGQLRDAAQYENGRPFGVQALIVGCARASKEKLSLFTLDPSGGYRHWGTATAIGKDASTVRKRLYELLSAREAETPCSAMAALDVAVGALLKKEPDSSGTRDEDGYITPAALLIWRSETSEDTISVATIKPTIVESRLHELISARQES